MSSLTPTRLADQLLMYLRVHLTSFGLEMHHPTRTHPLHADPSAKSEIAASHGKDWHMHLLHELHTSCIAMY